GRLQLRVHAGARVYHHRERNRKIRVIEEGKVLLDAVLEHAEVVLLEVRDVVSVAVRYRDAQRDEVNTGSKRRPRRTLTAAGRGLGRLGRADRDHSERG